MIDFNLEVCSFLFVFIVIFVIFIVIFWLIVVVLLVYWGGVSKEICRGI